MTEAWSQSFRVEGLNDIFLRSRPSIDEIWPQNFGKVERNSIIQISGSSESGKSIMIMELMARTVALEKGTNDDPQVLFINTERQFNIFKFDEICLKNSPSDLIAHPEHRMKYEESHTQQLDKLNILEYDASQFKTLKADVDKILSTNTQISLIVIDSLGRYFYLESQKAEEALSKEQYMKSYLQQFESLACKFGVTIVYTKPDFDLDSKRDFITTHFITLAKGRNNLFSMRIKTKDEERLHYYTIDFYGIKFIDGTGL